MLDDVEGETITVSYTWHLKVPLIDSGLSQRRVGTRLERCGRKPALVLPRAGLTART